MKTKIMLKYLYILCVVFCFFTSQSSAFDTTQYCKQKKDALNEKYKDIAQNIKQEYWEKLIEVTKNKWFFFLQNETCIAFSVSFQEIEYVKALGEDFEEHKKFLNSLKEDEFTKTIRWVCQDE